MDPGFPPESMLFLYRKNRGIEQSRSRSLCFYTDAVIQKYRKLNLYSCIHKKTIRYLANRIFYCKH